MREINGRCGQIRMSNALVIPVKLTLCIAYKSEGTLGKSYSDTTNMLRVLYASSVYLTTYKCQRESYSPEEGLSLYRVQYTQAGHSIGASVPEVFVPFSWVRSTGASDFFGCSFFSSTFRGLATAFSFPKSDFRILSMLNLSVRLFSHLLLLCCAGHFFALPKEQSRLPEPASLSLSVSRRNGVTRQFGGGDSLPTLSNSSESSSSSEVLLPVWDIFGGGGSAAFRPLRGYIGHAGRPCSLLCRNCNCWIVIGMSGLEWISPNPASPRKAFGSVERNGVFRNGWNGFSRKYGSARKELVNLKLSDGASNGLGASECALGVDARLRDDSGDAECTRGLEFLGLGNFSPGSSQHSLFPLGEVLKSEASLPDFSPSGETGMLTLAKRSLSSKTAEFTRTAIFRAVPNRDPAELSSFSPANARTHRKTRTISTVQTK